MADNTIRLKRSEMRKVMCEDFAFRPVGLRVLAEDIIHVDCSIHDRYAILNLSEFIIRNANRNILKLIDTLSALEKYGYQLLRNELFRPKDWREINMETTQYHDTIAGTEGAEDILKMFGYVNKTKDRLCFSEYVKEPMQEAVINILIDVIVAKEELDCYNLSSHPQPKELEKIIELKKEKDHRVDRHISTRSNIITPSNSSNIPAPKIQHVNAPSEHRTSSHRSYAIEPLDLPPCQLCGDSKGRIECKDCACSHCVECDREWHMHPKRKNHTNRITKGGLTNGDQGSIRSKSASGVSQQLDLLRPTSNAGSFNYNRAQSDSRLVRRSHTTASELRRQVSETRVTVLSHRVPTADTTIGDVDMRNKLLKERKEIEIRFGILEQSIMLSERSDTKYEHLLTERNNLRSRWREIELSFGNGTVTEQPRALRNDPQSPTERVEHAKDNLTSSYIEKNIRRPPTEDVSPYKKRANERNKEMDGDNFLGDSKHATATKYPVTYEQNTYIDFIDKNKPLEIDESHFSNHLHWECPYCTFVNDHFDRVICEMCSKTTLKQDRVNQI